MHQTTRPGRPRLACWIVLWSWLTAALVGAALSGDAPAAPAPRTTNVPESSVLVLDNCDPVFQDKAAYEDNLSCIDASGKLVFRVSGFNNCESIGSNHMVASDPARGWVWVVENVGKRIRKFDRIGKELLSINDVSGSALAVDPETGNLWVLTSRGTIYGDKTKVFSPKGALLATHDVSGYDIAYDGKGKAFWIAGQTLVKVDAKKATVLFKKQITAWCASCIAVHPSTGKVWVTVRQHPDVGGSKNELLGFDNDGALKQSIAMDALDPFHVSIDAKKGDVLLTLFGRAVRRYTAEGKLQAEYAFAALSAVADPTNGGVWVVTPEETLRLGPKGDVLKRVKHKGRTSQAWATLF